MWKKFYTNSGLILLAILGAGIWFSNARSLFPAKDAPRYADFDAVLAASPTPTPTPTTSANDFAEFMRQRRLSATAVCADGTYSYSANRRGACSHHGGVAQWFR